MKYLSIRSVTAVSVSLVFASACGRSSHHRPDDGKAPFVETVSSEPVYRGQVSDKIEIPAQGESKKMVQADQNLLEKNTTLASTEVTGELKFKKAAIFDREFLYGFDLQYSSGADADYELIPQAMALGHVPSFFRRLGDRLQLVADQSRLFESDINHPELLINEYQIVSEDDETLGVVLEKGGIVLNQVANGASAALPKQSWIRSVEYKADKNILLQETGLLLADGSVQTYLESLLPRATLVPVDYKGIEANADNEPLADRYRFLAAEKVFVPKTENGKTIRAQTAFASRFNLGENGTIDWYVTANMPDKFYESVQSGVEGWNRYFEPQLGRKVVRFLGKLPQDVKLGDPTYNIINWDSVAEAGAAYESQAVDPLSGIQSHSLVYLPLAWYNIGINLWKTRVDPELPTAAALKRILAPKGVEVLFGQKNILSCMRSADDMALPLQQMLSEIKGGNQEQPRSLDDFGLRLVSSVLFHEIGHALGLGHNFKGSLAFDGSKPISAENPTSYSIMDYNYYQAEMDLFGKLGESAGPSLEYDRQIISQLYNQGKDVKEADPVLGACDDDGADAVADGVDPLCVRYDSEKNPIDGVVHAFENLAAATGGKGVEPKTLAEALAGLGDHLAAQVGNSETVSSADLLKETSEKLGKTIGDMIGYFLATGAQSLRVNLRNNAPALHQWQSSVKVDEKDFRGRYLRVLNDALALKALPEAPAAALADLATALERAAITNQAVGATEEARVAAAAEAKKAFLAATDKKTKAGLSRVRQAVYGILGYDAANPFAFKINQGGELSRIEELAVTTLTNGLLGSLTGDPADVKSFKAERAVAAAQLKTFAPVSESVGSAKDKLKEALAKAVSEGNQEVIVEIRGLLKSFDQ